MTPIIDEGVVLVTEIICYHHEMSNREKVRHLFEDGIHCVDRESDAGESRSQRSEHRDETDDYR